MDYWSGQAEEAPEHFPTYFRRCEGTRRERSRRQFELNNRGSECRAAGDVGTRRIAHWNVTEHPTAEWTVQQFRGIVPGDQPQRFLIHDRDRIYSAAVDDAVRAMGLTVLKTPVRCPQANAFCERLIGTMRRECLDWLIVLNERHLRCVLREWVGHYNQARPHTSLGPGIPDIPLDRLAQPSGHQVPDGQRVIATPILGGLHHEYHLQPIAA